MEVCTLEGKKGMIKIQWLHVTKLELRNFIEIPFFQEEWILVEIQQFGIVAEIGQLLVEGAVWGIGNIFEKVGWLVHE
jgi:hypothetical protein